MSRRVHLPQESRAAASQSGAPMSRAQFSNMTTAQLRAAWARLEYLAGTSEEIDECALLLGRAQAAREELAAREVQS